MNKKVSVIIPTFKGASNLPRAVESVLGQTYQHIEIIVVDDNDPLSQERMETEKAMEKFSGRGIRYLRHEANRNGAAARNTGISRSTGDYICFLDDDDFLMPERIRESVEVLEGQTEFDAVYCSVIIANGRHIEGIVPAEKQLKQKDLLMNEMALGTGSNLFMTRRAMIHIGGFDETFKRHQDLEFMLRFLEWFSLVNLNRLLIVKATNGTNNVPEYTGLLEVKNRYFKKFEQEISQLKEEERRSFLTAHYEDLFFSAAMSKNSLLIEKSRKDLEVLRPFTIKDRALLIIVGKGLSKTKLYRKARPVYNAAKNRRFAGRLKRLIGPAQTEFVYRTLMKTADIPADSPVSAVDLGKRFEEV